ncbi:MAG: YifB family Mg chelatase-like AAA ATPase [Egibacteraceae bacterium]
MVGRAATVAVVGLEPVPVVVEAHVGTGLPGFSVIGSSGSAASQATHRVRTALRAVGVTLSSRKFLVSLAPADIPKTGARFDLAMAAALLVEEEKIAGQALERCVLLGELALDGSVRPVTGVLPAAASLAGSDRRLLVADANAAEAALVEGLEVVPISGLAEVVQVLRGEQEPRPVPQGEAAGARSLCADLADVRGQAEARRALEIAAAGGHHLLLLGPPGCGKSMLAHRLVGILPPLTRAEALELAAVRSVAGLLPETGGLDQRPPLRAPHHSMSAASLLGGGNGVARPGELSLAHRGCLFLDELFEWPRHLLESLREPLEEGVVRLARARATVTYPALVQIVAAANPCPCGGGARCTCSDEAIWAYRSRLSGPLADRFDLAPSVARLSAAALLAGGEAESSAAVAGRVATARAMATQRWGAMNRQARPVALRAVTRPTALRVLADAVDTGALTGRGFDRALRVARTCADLESSEFVEPRHAFEALAHRMQLRACTQGVTMGVAG